MIFVLKMLFTFVYDRKNENHWSLLIIRYSLALLGIQTPDKFPDFDIGTSNAFINLL